MKNESSKSALFLMELILAVLFFALSSAVCARLFVSSHVISCETQEANRAAALAQSAAACVQSAEGNFEAAAKLLSGTVTADGKLTVWYTADWQPLDNAANAVYCMSVLPAASAEQSQVIVTQGDRILLALPFGWHQPLHL